jgi:hypothetical protein
MDANLVGFVAVMDGAQYLTYHRYLFPFRRMCLPVRWRKAHVRVPVCSFVYL